jgi:hypothetical protein
MREPPAPSTPLATALPMGALRGLPSPVPGSPWRYRGSGGFNTKTVVGVSPTGLIGFSVWVSPTEIRYEPPLEFCFYLTTCSCRGRVGLRGAAARLAATARA